MVYVVRRPLQSQSQKQKPLVISQKVYLPEKKMFYCVLEQGIIEYEWVSPDTLLVVFGLFSRTFGL